MFNDGRDLNVLIIKTCSRASIARENGWCNMPLRPYSNVVRGNQPPSQKWMQKSPFPRCKVYLKVIYCFLYSFLLFPFFLRRLVQLEHLDKRKPFLVISDSIQYVYVMEISFFSQCSCHWNDRLIITSYHSAFITAQNLAESWISIFFETDHLAST